MKLSIVWRSALAVAVAQVANFIIIGTMAVNLGFGPVYRIWTDQAVDTLHAHHQLLREIADQYGIDAAEVAAGKLSVPDLQHQVVDQAKVDWDHDYMGMSGEQWRALGEAQNEPVWRDGWLHWITLPGSPPNGATQDPPVVILSSSRWPMHRAAWAHPTGTALWVGSGMLLSALVGGVVATWFTKPILRLRTSVTQFASGQLESRPDSRLQSRRDEIGDLARDLTYMKERIATLVGAQRQLLDDVAHELRSPLARMNVAVELAEQTHDQPQSHEPEGPKQFLSRIRRECMRLSDMVDRLLQLSALEHRVDDDESVEIDLTQLARTIAEDCNFEAQAVDRRVNLQADQDIRVLGNNDMLHAAIENIVRNAIRYTAAGESVDIDLRTADDRPDRALITIRDHGPGVAEDLLPRLFQPFYRVESDRSNDTGGAGLGLALAERVVRAHSGTITARNHAQGGLEFVIDLPINALRAVR
jgi:signal transduction histidine kinase